MKIKFIYPAGHGEKVRVKVIQKNGGDMNLILQYKGFCGWYKYSYRTDIDISFQDEYVEKETKDGERVFPVLIPIGLTDTGGHRTEYWPINKFDLRQRCDELLQIYFKDEKFSQVVKEQSDKIFNQ